MDVRCERCKTEYEFDDARITEAGVAVKCTTCGHVFKVKKKALVVTVPVKPDDVAAQNAIPALPSPPVPASAQDKREWKVRQANGNVFTFKELTTLQKWIVERKVARDDDISLTGETWKRLGNIAELASFFQVVEEAQKAAHLAALQAQGLLTPIQPPIQPIDAEQGSAPFAPSGPAPIAAAPVPSPAAAPASTPAEGASAIPGTDAGSVSFDAAVRATAAAMAAADARAQSEDVASGAQGATGPDNASAQVHPPSGVRGSAVTSASPSAPRSPPTLTPPQAASSATSARNSPRPESGEPRFVTTGHGVRNAAREVPDDDLAAAGLKRSGGVGKAVLYLLVLAAIGAGGYYGYLHYWLPSQSTAGGAPASGASSIDPAAPDSSDADAQVGGETGTAPTEVVQAHAAEDAGQATTEDAGTLADAPLDAGTSADVVAAAVAETPGASATEAVVPATTAAANVDEKPGAGRGYDYWLAQGDRLRVRERFAAALQAYGKAADLEPRRAEPRAGRGLVLLDQGREPQAEAAFREALELNPRYAVALMGLAETYKVMGKKAEAVQYYRKYLEILPNGPEAGVARAAIDRLKE